MLTVEMASIIWDKIYTKLGNWAWHCGSALERLSAKGLSALQKLAFILEPSLIFLHTAARGPKFVLVFVRQTKILSKWPVLPLSSSSLSPDNWNPSRHSAITAEVFGSISDFSHLRRHLTPASTSHVPGSIGMHWLKQFLSWGKIYVALGGLELVCRPNCTGTQIYLPLPAHSWFLYETVLMYNPGWSQLLRLQGCPVFLVVGLTT